MKSICKHIAFSKSGECQLGNECICKKNELWLEEEVRYENPVYDSDPFLIWLDEQIGVNENTADREDHKMEPNLLYRGQQYAFEAVKEKYLSLNKEEDHG
jgi:hypothetical protein